MGIGNWNYLNRKYWDAQRIFIQLQLNLSTENPPPLSHPPPHPHPSRSTIVGCASMVFPCALQETPTCYAYSHNIDMKPDATWLPPFTPLSWPIEAFMWWICSGSLHKFPFSGEAGWLYWNRIDQFRWWRTYSYPVSPVPIDWNVPNLIFHLLLHKFYRWPWRGSGPHFMYRLY